MKIRKILKNCLRAAVCLILLVCIILTLGQLGVITEDGIMPVCLLYGAFLFFCRIVCTVLERKRRNRSRNTVQSRTRKLKESKASEDVEASKEFVPVTETAFHTWQRSQSSKVNGIILFPLLVAVCGGAVGFLYHNSEISVGLPVFNETNNAAIPDSLLTFKSKYPETADFVDGYFENKDKDYSMDVSSEVQVGKIPLFIQWDERWGYKIYGDDFMAVGGCGPTCISMVVCGLTGNTQWNPYEAALFSEESGYYVPEIGTSWELMTTGAANLGLTAEYGHITADYILNSLNAGRPLICSMSPGDFTYSGHFIVLADIASDGKIIVNDPNSRDNSARHWEIDVLLSQIKAVWSYSASDNYDTYYISSF